VFFFSFFKNEKMLDKKCFIYLCKFIGGAAIWYKLLIP